MLRLILKLILKSVVFILNEINMGIIYLSLNIVVIKFIVFIWYDLIFLSLYINWVIKLLIYIE